VLETVRELGIGFVAYSPLGRGFLTGAFKKPEDLSADDFRHHHPRFKGENFDRNRVLVKVVEEKAASKGVTPAQLAIAWLLAKGGDIVPIPGTKHVSRLKENVGALEVSLTPQDMKELDAALPKGSTAGPRYADMSPIDR
jgi:aryl-alcohol dehydrogenase-like predicted oxidoreductase